MWILYLQCNKCKPYIIIFQFIKIILITIISIYVTNSPCNYHTRSCNYDIIILIEISKFLLYVRVLYIHIEMLFILYLHIHIEMLYLHIHIEMLYLHIHIEMLYLHIHIEILYLHIHIEMLYSASSNYFVQLAQCVQL